MSLLKVKTNKGIVTGKPGSNGKCSLFLGIPYAKPPVGELRFAAPVEIDAWEGEKDCTEFGFYPIQSIETRGPEKKYGVSSEDCLTINVFTPAEQPNEKLPVMFWFYGGGFSAGSTTDPEMDGVSLTEKGVVVVTVNYRVGVLGACSLPELDARNGMSVNAGILDQVMGLRWVQDNIAAFGGDPERVLIHGQSAGGVSVRMHLTSPLSRGLFSRAIVQSGGGLNEADPVRTKEDYTAICKRAMEHLGWTFDDLMTRDAQEVYTMMDKAARETATTFEVGFFQPFVDGYSIIDVPGKLISEGRYYDVPTICGTVCGDAWMFSRKVKEAFDNDLYFKGFAESPSQSWGQDNIQKGRTPIYTYFLDREQPPDGNPMRGPHSKAPAYGRQAPHGTEVAYVFGTLDVRVRERNCRFAEYDYKLSDMIQTYWTNFCKYGNPNSEVLMEWTPYTAEKPLTMHFGDTVTMENVVTSDIEQRCIDITKQKPGMLESLD